VPAYLDCRGTPQAGGGFSLGCGPSAGLIALLIGLLQVIYGFITGAIMLLTRRTAVGQGMFIGASVVLLLFTGLCFGLAVLG
jgi:hypothetical protein